MRLAWYALLIGTTASAQAIDPAALLWSKNATRGDIEVEAARVHAAMDLNGDGYVTSAELRKSANARVGCAPRAGDPDDPVPPMAQALFDAADLDHDGRASVEEAIASADAEFSRDDADHDGIVTPDERLAGARRLAEEHPVARIGIFAPNVTDADVDPATAALERCFAAPDTSPAAAAMPVPPPGLSRRSVRTAAITLDGNVYGYEGTETRELVCGVAIYGRVTPAQEARVRSAVERHKDRWAVRHPATYTLSTTSSGKQVYWGSLSTPGLSGVLMIVRPPASKAPTLEVDYHRELVM